MLMDLKRYRAKRAMGKRRNPHCGPDNPLHRDKFYTENHAFFVM